MQFFQDNSLILLIFAIIGLVAFIATRSKKKLTCETTQDSAKIALNEKPAKNKKAAVKGNKLNKHNWDSPEDYNPLFALRFPGCYHPHRAMYWSYWFEDNFDGAYEYYALEEQEEGAVEIAVEQFSSQHYVMHLIDSNGDTIKEIGINSDTSQVIIDGYIYQIDPDTDSIELSVEGETIAWDFENGYNLEETESTLTEEPIVEEPAVLVQEQQVAEERFETPVEPNPANEQQLAHEPEPAVQVEVQETATRTETTYESPSVDTTSTTEY